MRVFISSVMSGFQEEREVARSTIEALRMTPVMAETFGARSAAPQEACLKGVRESDCYLGIFAEKYGFVGPTGESATIEEFREAQKRGTPILIIRKKCAPGERDDRLSTFLEEVGDYQTGYFHGQYATLSQLGPEITRALHEWRGAGGSRPVGPSLDDRLAQFAKDIGREFQHPALVVAAGPADRMDSVDVRVLGKKDLHAKLSQLARYEAGVFDESLGSIIREDGESIEIVQSTSHRQPINLLRLDVDRAVIIARSLRNPAAEERHMGFLGGMVIDEAMIADALRAAISLAARVHGLDALKPTPPRLLFKAALINCSGKLLGRLGDQQVTSISHPGQDLAGPVIVPKEPVLLTHAQALDPTDSADRLRENFVRVFKAAKAYYEPSKARW